MDIGDDNELFFEHNTVEVHNKPLNFGFKIALYKGLNIDLELIQPLDEKGVYAEFLKEHGQGIHHIALSFEDENDYINTVEERGNEKIQTGLFISKSRGKKSELLIMI